MTVRATDSILPPAMTIGNLLLYFLACGVATFPLTLIGVRVVAYKCDLLVAIVDGNMADPDKRKMAHRFLESNTVQVWVNKQLEGR